MGEDYVVDEQGSYSKRIHTCLDVDWKFDALTGAVLQETKFCFNFNGSEFISGPGEYHMVYKVCNLFDELIEWFYAKDRNGERW